MDLTLDISLGDPTWAGGLDCMIPRGSFHPKLLCGFCDIVKKKFINDSGDDIRTVTIWMIPTYSYNKHYDWEGCNSKQARWIEDSVKQKPN